MMLRDTMKSWSDSQSDLYSSDQEEEEQMIFGENEDDLEEMMDLSDLPTSLFACSVHEAVFEVQEEKVRWREVYLGHSIVSIDTAIEQLCLNFQCVTAYYNWRGKKTTQRICLVSSDQNEYSYQRADNTTLFWHLTLLIGTECFSHEKLF